MAREMPSEAQIIKWFDTLSNWGRWGKEDQKGTLNLITSEKRKKAAGLVRDGAIVSCARTITYDAAADAVGLGTPRHFMNSTADAEPEPGSYGRYGTMDTFLFGPHGLTITHLDAPAHVLWRSDPGKPRTLYNGQSAKGITARGAAVGSIELAGDGIVSRGVLLDIAGLQKVDWLEPGAAIFTEDLEAAEKAQGIRVEPGDVLFVRTGHPARRAKMGPVDPPSRWSGLQAACLPWLRERDVALLSCDTPVDVGPMQYPKIGYPIHGVGMAGLGLWLIDNSDYEQLAVQCRHLGRWEFFVSIGALKWDQGTGSPVNPIAVF